MIPPGLIKLCLATILLSNSLAFSATANTQEDQRFNPIAPPSSVLLLEANGGRCTANVISNSGLILTARHCLQSCLIQSGVFQMVYEQASISYFLTSQEKLGKSKCIANINGEPTELTIEATSPGFLAKVDEAGMRTINPKLMERLVREGYTSKGDFVVARFAPKQKMGCLPLQPKIADELIFTSVGFPGITNRPDGNNSDGVQAFFSRGHLISSIAENSCVVSDKLDSSAVSRLKESFDDSTAFITTLDAIYGSSGTGVLNSKGEIIGILSNVYRHAAITRKVNDEPENRFCSGSAKALKVEQILKLMQSRPEILKEAQCE